MTREEAAAWAKAIARAILRATPANRSKPPRAVRPFVRLVRARRKGGAP